MAVSCCARISHPPMAGLVFLLACSHHLSHVSICNTRQKVTPAAAGRSRERARALAPSQGLLMDEVLEEVQRALRLGVGHLRTQARRGRAQHPWSCRPACAVPASAVARPQPRPRHACSPATLAPTMWPAPRTDAKVSPSCSTIHPPTWPVAEVQGRQGAVTARSRERIHCRVPITASGAAERPGEGGQHTGVQGATGRQASIAHGMACGARV